MLKSSMRSNLSILPLLYEYVVAYAAALLHRGRPPISLKKTIYPIRFQSRLAKSESRSFYTSFSKGILSDSTLLETSVKNPLSMVRPGFAQKQRVHAPRVSSR